MLALSEQLIESHVGSAFRGASALAAPTAVDALIAQVAARSRTQLLDDRTVVKNGQRRFMRGARYRDLPPEVLALIPGALATYASRLTEMSARRWHSSRSWMPRFASQARADSAV